MSKNVNFSETRFSQGIGVGLRLYTDYMISKNGCDWFHWVLTCLLWKWNSFGKVIKRDELYDFDDFVVVCRWNAHVYSTTLICDLSVYIVEALEFVYLDLVQLSQLF